MLRYFYISSDLDDLEKIEEELEKNGITKNQIHVLSEDDAELDKHHLHGVSSILKKDIVKSMENGLALGCILASLSLLVPYFLRWTETQAGWMPFIILAIILLGFCTWEGGLIGIQKINSNFKKFQNDLLLGKHVLFVDIDTDQKPVFSKIIDEHPTLVNAGSSKSVPKWFINVQNAISK